MGIVDTIKGMFKGREHQIKSGIDKVSDTLERRVPSQAARIDDFSDKAKGAVDKLGAEPAARAPATATPPSPTPTPPSPASSHAPPASTPSTPATPVVPSPSSEPPDSVPPRP